MQDFNDDFLFRYLKKAKIPFIKQDVEEILFNHPGAASLKSVSDTLEELNVKTMTVSLDTADLDELDFPVITHLQQGHGEFVLLESKQNGEIKYFRQGKLEKEKVEAFKKKWSGTTILLDASNKWGIENPKTYYWNKYGKSALYAFGGLVLLTLMFFGVNSGSVGFGIYLSTILLLNLSGLGLSLYLYKIHLNKSARNDKFCKKTRVVDCTAVLFSKWSKLFGLFNWAQLGIIYFFGQSLGLILGFLNPDSIQFTILILSTIGLIAGCFSIYSIILQAFVIKKWCSLCLISQGVILATIVLNYYQSIPSLITFQIIPILTLSGSYLSGFILTLEYSSLHELKKKAKEKTLQTARLTGDESIFKHILHKQRLVNDFSHLDGIVKLGNQAAPNEILMFASLHCRPCVKMFGELTELLAQHADQVKLTIIFTMQIGTSSKELPINSRLINLTITEKEDKVIQAIHSWHDLMGHPDAETLWLNQNTPNRLLNEIDLTTCMMNHKKWISESMISQSPTLFFNNYEVPQIYANASKLKHFLN